MTPFLQKLYFYSDIYVKGTMANLLAVMSHCNGRSQELIVGSENHIYTHEQASSAQVSYNCNSRCHSANLNNITYANDIIHGKFWKISDPPGPHVAL